MARASHGPKLQPYPREKDVLLAKHSLFPPFKPPMTEAVIQSAIDAAFRRCVKTKTGKDREVPENPDELVELCIEHLRGRSDPIHP